MTVQYIDDIDDPMNIDTTCLVRPQSFYVDVAAVSKIVIIGYSIRHVWRTPALDKWCQTSGSPWARHIWKWLFLTCSSDVCATAGECHVGYPHHTGVCETNTPREKHTHWNISLQQAVSAAGLQGKCLRKTSVLFTDTGMMRCHMVC